MATGERQDPYLNYKFKVEIDGIITAAFSEVTIPDVSTEATEYREGTDPPTPRKLSGLIKYGNITLKKGITDSLELYNWWKLVETGGASKARKNLSLILVDEEDTDKAQWDIIQAWPSKYDSSDFSAKGNEVMVETLEIVHEGVIRVK